MYKKWLLFLCLVVVFGNYSLNVICLAQTKTNEEDLGIYKMKFEHLADEIGKNTDLANNYLRKADLHLEFYQYQEAENLYKQALDLVKDDNMKKYLTSLILFTESKYDEATSELDKIIAATPNFARAYYTKGLIELQKENEDKALEYFNKTLEIDSNFLEAMNKVGWIYIDKADYDNAIKYFNQILYRDQEHVGALDGKGYALYKLGLYDEALPYIDEAIILLPDSWGAWTTKGEIYLSKSNYFLAEYCLKRAEKINPDTLAVQILKQKLNPIVKKQ